MKKRFAFVLLGWLTLLMVACDTEVELCEEYEHPHAVSVEYNFFWGGINPNELNDSMMIVATRVIDLWKSSARVSSTGSPSEGTYLWNAPKEITDTVADINTFNTSWFKLRRGEYKFVTFNRNDEEIDYENVDRYMRNDAMPMSELNAVYKSYPKNDPHLKLLLPDWTDYNGYSDYMQPSSHPIYYDTLTYSIREKYLHRILFHNLRRLTQRITLKFDILKDSPQQPFTIDSVFVEMSGLPYVINLASGYIDITKTKKMMFKAKFAQDTETSKKVSCSAIMDVPSIVKSESDDLYMGPGIMQVMICCSAVDPDDPTQRRNKKFQGIINLFHTLERANLIRLTEDGQHALRNMEEAVLVINAEMVVDGEKVLESSDDNGGLDVWKRADSSIVVDI